MDKQIEKGLCQCGCGEKTKIAHKTNSHLGHVRNQPIKYIKDHQNRGRIGPDSAHWRGGRTSSHGYVLILKPNHPKANSRGYIQEHILIAEKVLGKLLPTGAVIHHINENRSDNRKENLVICQDENYHRFLHVRLRALKACGNPNWKKCRYCKEWDDPENLYIDSCNQGFHKKCRNKYCKQLRIRNKKYEVSDETD